MKKIFVLIILSICCQSIFALEFSYSAVVLNEKSGKVVPATYVYDQISGKKGFGNDNGVFTIPDIRVFRVRLLIRAAGFSPIIIKKKIDPAERDTFYLVPVSARQEAAPCDTCNSGTIIYGKVIDADTKKSVSAIRLEIEDEVTSTDNDGHFTLISMDIGDGKVRFSGEGYHDTTISVKLSKNGDQKIDLEITPIKRLSDMASVINGITMSETGDPVEGVTVSILNQDKSSQSDESGIYLIENILPGTYTLMASRWGYDIALIDNVVLGEKDTLKRAIILKTKGLDEVAYCALNGSVKDTLNVPVDSAKVRVVKDSINYEAITTIDGQYNLDSLPEGVYTLKIWKIGFDTTIVNDVDLWAGESVIKDVVLKPQTLLPVTDLEPGTGAVSGVVVSADKGTPVAGAVIKISGKRDDQFVTDMDGRYTAVLKVGVYSFNVASEGYETRIVANVPVNDQKSSTMDFLLEKAGVSAMSKMVIRGVTTKTSSAALLKERQTDIGSVDAVSAEEFKKSGASDAADVMKQVTGSSIVGGKYVYIRGLGERYTNVVMNGSVLPSPDPDKKAVPVDMFPANLIENIKIRKTFVPEGTADFTGGFINIKPLSSPEKKSFKISLKGGIELGTTGHEYLTYKGGKLDWLGIDDGTRDIPLFIKDYKSDEIPSNISDAVDLPADSTEAKFIDDIAKSFNKIMYPIKENAHPDWGISGSMGNTFYFGPRMNSSFGYNTSLSYKYSTDSYNDGIKGQYDLTSNFETTEELQTRYLYDVKMGKNEVLWGGLATIELKLRDIQKISVLYMYNRNAEDKIENLIGERPGESDVGANDIFDVSILHYKERDIHFLQFSGNHILGRNFRPVLDWKFAYSKTLQNEPDLRFFPFKYAINPETGDTSYFNSINVTNTGLPERFYRNLDEKGIDFSGTLNLPFSFPWVDNEGSVKLGGSIYNKEREFRFRQYTYKITSQPELKDSVNFKGDPEELFADSNMGIIDTIVDSWWGKNKYGFGWYISSPGTDKSNYNASQKVPAGFLMATVPIINRLELYGGVRYEHTFMNAQNIEITDSSNQIGEIDRGEWFPSAGGKLTIVKNMNFRAAYGKTIARPSMREFAPFASIEFPGSGLLNGNANLKSTIINNYDLRWEWYYKPGGILALSGFYKDLKDPIEFQILYPENGDKGYKNVDKGKIIGMEFEAKGRLWDNRISIGGNFALVNSEVSVDSMEYEKMLQNNPKAEKTRPLWGQSPYLVNVSLSFDDVQRMKVDSIQVGGSIFYNVFGKRLSKVSYGVTPNVYELPRHELNLSTYVGMKKFKLKFSFKNIINTPVKEVLQFKGKEYVAFSHSKERKISMTLSRKF